MSLVRKEMQIMQVHNQQRKKIVMIGFFGFIHFDDYFECRFDSYHYAFCDADESIVVRRRVLSHPL